VQARWSIRARGIEVGASLALALSCGGNHATPTPSRAPAATATPGPVPPRDARAECGDAELTNLELAGGAISFCRVRSDGDAPPKVLDCLRLDLANGSYESLPAPAALEALPDELTPPVTAEMTPAGAKVCKPGGASICTVVAILDAHKFDAVASNSSRTILAARTKDQEKPVIETFDVASGKHLASVKAWGDVVEVLGETLFVLQPCAAPCSGKLWDARTGKKIADVSDDIAAANSAEVVNVGADVWAFKEFGREEGEDGVLFQDVKSGQIVRRIGGSTIARPAKDHEVPYFRLMPAPQGVLALVAKSLQQATPGDAALIDRVGAVRRFDAPACPE